MADELKLTTGESDLQLVSSQGGNIQIDKGSLEMNDLALSNATKYLATYNNPKDWILDEKEAKMAQVLHSVEPEKSSMLGTGAYAVGELLRTTYSAPRDFVGAISAGKAILEDTFFPNAETSALERWADNYGKIEAQRERVSDELIAQEVGHPKIYNYGTAALQLIRDIALTGGVAKAGASVAAKGAARKVAGRAVSEDVAQRYATAMAKRGAKRAGEATIGGSVFVQETGSGLVNNINQYIDKTGDYDLKYYDPTVDLAVNIGVGALSAKIEKGLGVERFVPRMIVRGSGDKIPALTQILIGGVEGFVGEGGEEGAQTAIRQIGDMISGYRDWGDFDLDEIWTNMTVGGVLGAGAGSGLHYLNRRAAIRRLTDEGLDPKTAADLVDTIASREINKTLNDLSAVTELKTQSGQAYDKLKAGIKNALELQGWSEKMIDPQTNAELSIDEYSELVAKGMTDTAVREANKSGLPIDTFLDVASFANINNVLYLRPLGTPEQIQQRIDEQDAIIARQRELKKTGAGNETLLKEARMKRNILLNAYVQAKVRQESQKVKLEQAQTEETKKEITTATQDAESLTKTESAADFNAELDNKTQDGQPITTGQKIKRFGNAVIKKIMGSDKTGFDSIMSLPEYTNARTAIVNSADRIFEFAKKHRTYGIYKDLRNALKQMQTVNAENFIESITTPNLSGDDVVAQNAFLYHFIFSDADTISTYIDAYLERADASINSTTGTSLSKKDLVGQAFRATDGLMQTKADSAGQEYTSIYREDGSVSDENVAAVLMSYQNQFVEDTQKEQPTEEEQKEAQEQAKDVADGTITTGAPETPTENVIKDYGEKIEGAKKDIIGTKGEVAQSDIDKIMKKGPRSDIEKQILKNWLEQQDPEFVTQIRQLNLPIRVSKTTEYRNALAETYTQHPELNLEEDRYDVLSGGAELSRETLDKYGIVPEHAFCYRTPDGYYVSITPENVAARLGGRGALQFSYSKSTRGEYFLWAKKGSGSWVPLISFETREEMDEHRNSHTQEDREKLYNEMTTYKDNRKKVIRERVGKDYRNGQNITEKEFAEAFGFRGVQFGNYENNEKRQREINNSYDSFMDLANILNLPPKAISLGGTLGIAFGARGSGTALAHYEPAQKVINITRDAGAGALAHEWFHALDNYLAQNLSEYANMAGGGFVTKGDNYYYYRVNAELSDALKEYLRAIKGESGFQMRLRQLGQYWKRDWEVAARLFEQYVSSKVAEQNGINDYLANPQEYYQKATPYLTAEESSRVFPKIESMLGSIKTRESDDGNVILYQGKQANGFYDPELSVILLGKNWNTMTLPHELAHYWLDTLFSVYKRVSGGELKANAEWLQEKKDMFVMLGIDENQEKLTAGQQEKFARMVESYLTGIGVSKEMNQTFKEYFKWVPEKYKSILQLGYLDDQGKIQYPFLDQASVDFFNRWYENASLPSLPTSPERQRFMNATGDDGQTQRVSIKEMNDRQKEFGQDAEEQIRTDERLYNTLDENMSAETKPVADAQKVVIAERGNFLKESEQQQRRWYDRKSRDTEAQLAQDYIEKNPDHAKEVIFGDPELVPNDTGIDRATLINAYMALNNITPDKPEWATLHTNIAINQSLAGTQLALSNDKSYGAYLDALREVENALELKAATNYAGSKQGARERFNTDIQRFLDRELPSVFATTPNSKERETALKVLFEKARTTFSGNTTGTFLNQVDLDYAMGQKGKTEAFMRWATNQIKKDAGAKLNNEQQAKLLQLSAKAQQALIDLDNPDADKAVAAAQELRKWQVEKDKLMGVSQRKFSLFGDWAPRAMLASINTLVVANVPSTAINTAVTNLAKRGLTGGIFGEHNVSKNLVDKEVDRIKRIWWATGMNLAQMEKPTSPSLLHGEKYSASGQKIYDPYTILGWEDNYFRVPTFVNTLARIASTDAKATGRSADEVFREYASLNNQSDAAKLARKQALAVANMAVFTQDGALASCLNHIRSELNRLSRVMLGLDPKGFGLGNLLAPFLTTGANIAEMGIRGSLAPITTITSLVNSWRTGKAIDPMKKLALRMDWAYFGLSAVAMVLLATLTSDDDEFYADPYVTGKKYDPNKPYDSINIGGVWLDLDFFGPFAIPMRTAAKVIQAWEKDNGIGAVLTGYGASAKSVIGDIPLAESIINNQVSYAVKKPSNWGASYVYNQANKLVPAIVKPVSRAVSRGYGLEYEGEWLGTTVGRKFHRNYGFDGLELTSQDLIEMLTTKVQLDESINKKI